MYTDYEAIHTNYVSNLVFLNSLAENYFAEKLLSRDSQGNQPNGTYTYFHIIYICILEFFFKLECVLFSILLNPRENASSILIHSNSVEREHSPSDFSLLFEPDIYKEVLIDI